MMKASHRPTLVAVGLHFCFWQIYVQLSIATLGGLSRSDLSEDFSQLLSPHPHPLL
jgi:hypothetical protein